MTEKEVDGEGCPFEKNGSRSGLQDWSSTFTGERLSLEGGGGLSAKLYDFQAAACKCLSKVLTSSAESRALLVMGTGLGKSVVFIYLMRLLGGGAIWLVPSGLATQASEELVKASVPAGMRQVIRKREDIKRCSSFQGVSVVNVALLRGGKGQEIQCGVVVVDECHRIRSAMLGKLRRTFKGARFLFGTATPQLFEDKITEHRRLQVRREAVFVCNRSPGLCSSLALSLPDVVVDLKDVAVSPSYWDSVVALISLDLAKGPSGVSACLTAVEMLCCLPSEMERPRRLLLQVLPLLFMQLRKPLRITKECALVADELMGRFSLGDFGAMAGSLELGSKWHSALELGSKWHSALQCRPHGTRAGETSLPLRRSQRLLEISRACLKEDSSPLRLPNAGTLSRFLVRVPAYPSASHVSCTEDVECLTLSSSHSAREREKIIGRFCSDHRLQRHILRHQVVAQYSGSLSGTLSQWFDRRVEELLERAVCLIADRSVDVGFNVHTHVSHICTSEFLCSSADISQLAGRWSRLGRRTASCTLVMPVRLGTLEEITYKEWLAQKDCQVSALEERTRRTSEGIS